MDHIGANLENTKRNIEIIDADLVSLHGFTRVPNFILTNKELSVGAKLYYAMLLKHALYNNTHLIIYIQRYSDWEFTFEKGTGETANLTFSEIVSQIRYCTKPLSR